MIEALTEEGLAAPALPPEDGGWPPRYGFTVAKCLSIVLNEEFWHRTYAERDLAVLQERSAEGAAG